MTVEMMVLRTVVVTVWVRMSVLVRVMVVGTGTSCVCVRSNGLGEVDGLAVALARSCDA